MPSNRPRALFVGAVAASILLVGCAQPGSEPPPTTMSPVLPTVSDATPEWEPAAIRPVWEGFAATQEIGELAALARGPIDVFDEPGAATPTVTLDRTTILGTITVLGVVTPPRDGWAEVMLPLRPNGSTGWIETSAVDFYVADARIEVDLTDRRLRYMVDGVEVLTTEVGIGSRFNWTPEGEFFVTDNVTLANPNSPWGPHALGLSARSDTITEYNGGDGIIGIHGTNNPSSIGGNISLGCVRLPNDMITALHELVPIGTRVIVEA